MDINKDFEKIPCFYLNGALRMYEMTNQIEHLNEQIKKLTLERDLLIREEKSKKSKKL